MHLKVCTDKRSSADARECACLLAVVELLGAFLGLSRPPGASPEAFPVERLGLFDGTDGGLVEDGHRPMVLWVCARAG
jgi:hypothetical protein